MTKNTDNQRAVLEAAARGANLVAWPVPAKLKLNAGSAAIVVKGLLKKGLLAERPVLGDDAVWHEDEEGRQMTIFITKTGLATVGMMPGSTEENEARATPTGSDDEQPVLSPEETAAATGDTAAVSNGVKAPRSGTKLAEIVALLSREEGATVEEMATATGWQAHTVRGVMSGALVKKFGLQIVSEPDNERGRVYRAG